MRKPRRKVLVLSDFKGRDANVVRDYLYCFNQHSRNDIYYLHAWTTNNCLRLWNFDFERFDAIVLFWDFFWIGAAEPSSYCHVPDWVATRIAESSALKIQFLQDEYRDVRLANRSMARFGVNVMFSCVAPKDQELFYPKSAISTLRAVYPVLTGYVPTYLERVHWPASLDRPIDIGYRSRKLPYHLGKLGQEKHVIAFQFQHIADQFGFSADISVKEEDRLYGEDWLEFMRSCRFSLGTESGASVVDFDGIIKKKCVEFLRLHPEGTFDDASDAAFAAIDGATVVQTISPRIFEAAAFENTLILHEGLYENMLKADVHYISVKKDYSNIQDVVARMKDRPYCEKLAINAKEVLIDSRAYAYQAFVKRFDEILESHLPAPLAKKPVSRVLFHAMNYLNNDRLLPHGDAFLAIPNACDAAAQAGKYAPYFAAVFYSALVVGQLLLHAPFLLGKILQGFLRYDSPSLGLLIALLKDLRILGLLMRARHAPQGSTSAGIALELIYRSDQKQMVIHGVRPPKFSGDAAKGAMRVATEERDMVNELLRNGVFFSLMWDHSQIGNALGLRSVESTNTVIHLNDDCLYRFDTFQYMMRCLGDDRERFLLTLFFCREAPRASGKILSAICELFWAAFCFAVWDVPVHCGRKCLCVLYREQPQKTLQSKRERISA